MSAMKVGLIGCGVISRAYAEKSKQFEEIDIVACADLDPQRAKALAEEKEIPKACTPEEIFADKSIDMVLNLTIPAVHASISIEALQAGKHVYLEKPLAVEREDARAMLKLAKEKNLRVGCAPDTVLGAGIQTCRKVVDDGGIGNPVSVSGFMMGAGPEGFHPDPEFFYKHGGGPLFDMGPYYLTAMVTLLGPITEVRSMTKITYSEREILKGPKAGNKMPVETPTHISTLLAFESGVMGTLVTSFDTKAAAFPPITLFGSAGTLEVVDPNGFGNTPRILRSRNEEWVDVPVEHQYEENSRSLGAADMAAAIKAGRQHRANDEVAFHVLDIMHSILEAGETGNAVKIASRCERPEAMPLDGRL